MVGKKLQILLESGLNILLDGPQGCGKTVLTRSIAETLGMEFVFFNCGAVIEATDFFATIQVRATDGGQPVTDFVKTDVLEALERAVREPDKRFLVFLDELNRCPENARNALMPALDTTRKVFHPIDNRFLAIPDNVQFIAAVNRGQAFSATFGIDPAQLDRFAPLAMDYLPPDEEVKLLRRRHPEVGRELTETVVRIADAIRNASELDASLSVRATEEACIYLKHPLMEQEAKRMLGDVLQSSFCGRFDGRWDDPQTDAGLVWAIVQQQLKESFMTSGRRGWCPHGGASTGACGGRGWRARRPRRGRSDAKRDGRPAEDRSRARRWWRRRGRTPATGSARRWRWRRARPFR